MKPTRLALVVLVPLALAGCGVPDLVAHGVKSYEKSQERGSQQPAIAQPVQPAPTYQPTRYEPEPQSEPVTSVPSREPMMAEPLR
ncbi:MAG: hypothetical protein H7Y60_01545 [Rhodospirillaceae bacterium]|nr:hypothetical protein [Rhodospirillales bacterium]